MILRLVFTMLLGVFSLFPVLALAQSAGTGFRLPESPVKHDLDQLRHPLVQAQVSQTQEPQESQRRNGTLSLTLLQSIEIALQHNLRLQIATLTRDAVQLEIPKTKAQFHPTVGLAFTASGEKSVSELPDAKTQEINVQTKEITSQNVTAFLSQDVPTGATLILSNDLLRKETRRDIPPAQFDSALTVSVVQPLLRGGGVVVATRPIKNAEFDLRIEEARLRAEILKVTAGTKSAYYNTILAEKVIEVTEQAIQRDKALIEASQALLKAGLVTKRDVFSAEISLAKDSAKLAGFRGDLETAQNALLDTLGLPIATEVLLLDKDLDFQPVPLTLEEWVATAIRNRPELMEIEELLNKSSLTIRVARNTLLPQVDLVASYGKSKLGSTFGRSSELSGYAWSAGAVFSMPIGNVAAKSTLAQTKIDSARLQQELVQAKRQVELEVRAVVIKLSTSLEQMKAHTTIVEQATGKLEVARARFALGDATNFDITDAQDALLKAQTDLLTAIVDYNIGLAKLEASIAGPI